MTLPIQPDDMTMTMVCAELGIAPPLTLGDSRVRTLAGKPSGAVSMSDLRGKSAFNPTLTSVQTSQVQGPTADRYVAYTATVTCQGASSWVWSLTPSVTPADSLTGSNLGGGVYLITWREYINRPEEDPPYGSFTISCVAGNGSATKTIELTDNV